MRGSGSSDGKAVRKLAEVPFRAVMYSATAETPPST